MRTGWLLSLAAACSIASAALPASAPVMTPAAPAAVVTTAMPAPGVATPSAPGALTGPIVVTPAPMASAAAGSLLQTILALCAVLAALAALAWAMKRYGPKGMKGNAALQIVGSLSLGGRERILVIEIGDQWIVVGAAPGRVSALATMARQDSAPPDILMQQNGLAAPSFSEWLKQTIEKRNGK